MTMTSISKTLAAAQTYQTSMLTKGPLDVANPVTSGADPELSPGLSSPGNGRSVFAAHNDGHSRGGRGNQAAGGIDTSQAGLNANLRRVHARPPPSLPPGKRAAPKEALFVDYDATRLGASREPEVSDASYAASAQHLVDLAVMQEQIARRRAARVAAAAGGTRAGGAVKLPAISPGGNGNDGAARGSPRTSAATGRAPRRSIDPTKTDPAVVCHAPSGTGRRSTMSLGEVCDRVARASRVDAEKTSQPRRKPSYGEFAVGHWRSAPRESVPRSHGSGPGDPRHGSSNLDASLADPKAGEKKLTKQQRRMHELGLGYDVDVKAVPNKEMRRRGSGYAGLTGDGKDGVESGAGFDGKRSWAQLRGVAAFAGAMGAARTREERKRTSVNRRSRNAVDAAMELGPLVRAKRERENRLRRTSKFTGVGGPDGIVKPGSRGRMGSRGGIGSRGRPMSRGGIGSRGGSRPGSRGSGGSGSGSRGRSGGGLPQQLKRGDKGWGWSLLRQETKKGSVANAFALVGRFNTQSELERLAAQPRRTPPSAVAAQALELNAEGNLLKRATAAKDVTRQASLKAQAVYQSLDVNPHQPAGSEAFQTATRDVLWQRPFFKAPERGLHLAEKMVRANTVPATELNSIVDYVNSKLEHFTGEADNMYLAQYIAKMKTMDEVTTFLADNFGDSTGARRLSEGLFNDMSFRLPPKLDLSRGKRGEKLPPIDASDEPADNLAESETGLEAKMGAEPSEPQSITTASPRAAEAQRYHRLQQYRHASSVRTQLARGAGVGSASLVATGDDEDDEDENETPSTIGALLGMTAPPPKGKNVGVRAVVAWEKMKRREAEALRRKGKPRGVFRQNTPTPALSHTRTRVMEPKSEHLRKIENEFNGLWKRLSRDIKEIMNDEDIHGWDSLHDFLGDEAVYSRLKEVFQYYCTVDDFTDHFNVGNTLLNQPKGMRKRRTFQHLKKASKFEHALSSGKVMNMDARQKLFMMSSHEWLAFANDIGALADDQGDKQRQRVTRSPAGADAPAAAAPQTDEDSGASRENSDEVEGKLPEYPTTSEQVDQSEPGVSRVGTLFEKARGLLLMSGMAGTLASQVHTEILSGRQVVEKIPVSAVSGSVKKEELNRIFIRTNWERDDDGHFADDPSNPDNCMLMFEFVHGLIRIATEVVSVPGLSVKDRLEIFLTQLVLPSAQFVDVEGFRDAVSRNMQLQSVLDVHYKPLHNVFARYSSIDTRARTINLAEFRTLLTQAGLWTEGFSEAECDQVFAASQKHMDYDVLDAADVDLTFDEFKECLCRVADRAMVGNEAKGDEDSEDDGDEWEDGGSGTLRRTDPRTLARRVRKLLERILDAVD